MSPAQAEALRVFRETGNKRETARILGKAESTVRKLLRRAEAAEGAPEGQKAAIKATGTQGIAKAGRRIIQHKDGSRDSVYWRADEPEAEQPEDVIDRIADRLNRIQPAPRIKRPNVTRADIRNFVPLFDVHLSMRVGEYGTASCVSRLRTGIADLMERSPPAEVAILVNGGDFTEQNDPSNQTPQSKHPLSVDGDYDDTTDIATDVTVEMIETALKRSDHVIYKALRGNHDPNTARILRAALRQRYRNEPRVTIEDGGIEVFQHVWESNMIFAWHGDQRRKLIDVILSIAALYPQEWAQSVFRELYYGHLHSALVEDHPGMTANRVRAIAPPGHYARNLLLTAPSEMLSITYRKGGGRLCATNHIFEG